MKINILFRISLVFIILVLSGILAFTSARKDSATTDEPVHLGAGYTYLTRYDFRFDPEHPPLLKEISAFPLLFEKINLPSRNLQLWDKSSDFFYDSWKEARTFGNQLVYRSGNSADLLLIEGRLSTIVLFLILALFVFFWAKKLYGWTAGFLALILTAFCPNLMAHARLINTDLGFTLFFVVTIFSWGKFLKNQNWLWLILSGLFLGLAASSKFSFITLIPILFVLTLIYFYFRGNVIFNPKNQWPKYQIILAFILMLIISWLIVFTSYGFSVEHAPLVKSISEAFSISNKVNILPKFYNLHFIATLAHIFLPAYFLKGLVLVLSHVTHGHQSYLLGVNSIFGWWYYFPIAFLAKMPVSALILIVLAIINFKKYRSQNLFDEILIIVPIILYFIITMFSKADLGIRHLLPIFPLIYIYISRLGKVFEEQNPKVNIIKIITSILFVWFIIANFVIYPHYIAYFNEIAGGPKNGPKILLDSNIDWGQDLIRLKEFINNNNIQKLSLDYKWDKDALDYYKIKYQSLSPKDSDRTGWIAISVSSLYGAPDENGHSYEWLKKQTPVERIGYSIYIYNIKEDN